MRQHFDNIADVYYNIVDRVWYDIGYYHQREEQFIREKFRVRVGVAIDAGCGPGRHTALLGTRSQKVIAVDISREMLKLTRGHVRSAGQHQVAFVQADVRCLPIRNSVADFVLNVEVLEHLPGAEAGAATALLEFRRVLRKGGRLVTEAPLQRHTTWKRFYARVASYKEVTQDERRRYYELFPLVVDNLFKDEIIDALLERAGFEQQAKRFVRFFPSGLIELYPFLRGLDELLEKIPFFRRFCREALWSVRTTHESHELVNDP